jgi:hypothetical protein
MSEDAEKIARLAERAEVLMKMQNTFQKEIADLQSEIQHLKAAMVLTETSHEAPVADPGKTVIETEDHPVEQV